MTRILAIDLSSRGFGFVLAEDSQLIHWGTASGGTNGTIVLGRFKTLAADWRPTTLLIDDYLAPTSRRCARIRNLLAAIEQYASQEGIRVRRLATGVIQAAFYSKAVETKEDRAKWLASRFRELAPRLPPVRRLWMSEDQRMSIFDAAALLVAHSARSVGTSVIPGMQPRDRHHRPGTSRGTR